MTATPRDVQARTVSAGPRSARWQLAAALLRRTPVPGRWMPHVLKALAVDLEAIPVPRVCRDRWNTFSVIVTNLRDPIQQHILFQGYFEYRESRFVQRVLRPGDVFLDVGANLGWHALLAAHQVGPRGQVMAVEADPESFALLQRNAAQNGFAQIEALHLAASNRDGSATISAAPDNPGAASLFVEGSARRRRTEVPARRLDDLIARRGLASITLAKIDVEGAEMDVLEGMEQTLERGVVSRVMIEINAPTLRRAGRQPEEIFRFFERFGFTARDLLNRPRDLAHLPACINLVFSSNEAREGRRSQHRQQAAEHGE